MVCILNEGRHDVKLALQDIMKELDDLAESLGLLD